eukprot:scaffold50615_cov71-Phaeocystis_antarctica.AAC.3
MHRRLHRPPSSPPPDASSYTLLPPGVLPRLDGHHTSTLLALYRPLGVLPRLDGHHRPPARPPARHLGGLKRRTSALQRSRRFEHLITSYHHITPHTRLTACSYYCSHARRQQHELSHQDGALRRQSGASHADDPRGKGQGRAAAGHDLLLTRTLTLEPYSSQP